ncbi:MAG TPA: tetratricopeptide repeat protein [Longimicrobiaceae bacterium]|nr:tetratricopeptide repeat protein [Longimicrobiaceae bacterium]
MRADAAAGGEAPPRLAARALAEEQLGRWEAAAGLYALCFRGSVAAGDVAGAADALRGQARVLVQEERYDEAEELAALSLEIAERAGLVRSAARAVNVLGIVRYAQRDWGAAQAHYQRALELAMDLGDDDLVGLACQNLGVVANLMGNLREARTLYLESIGSFVRSGNGVNAVMAYNNLGMATADLSEWMEAEVYFSRGIEIAERLSQHPWLARLHTNRAEPLIHIGELERAEASLEQAERAATRVGDRLSLADVARWRGVIARVGGELEACEGHLLRSLDLAWEPSLERADALRELGALREAQGRGREAREAYEASRETFRSIGLEGYARGVAEQLERLEGLAPAAAAPGSD